MHRCQGEYSVLFGEEVKVQPSGFHSSEGSTVPFVEMYSQNVKKYSNRFFFFLLIKYITNLPVGAMAESKSVILGGTGSRETATSPRLISSPPGVGVKLGYIPGAGVMGIMSGKGVVLMGTASASSPAEERRLHNCLINVLKS